MDADQPAAAPAPDAAPSTLHAHLEEALAGREVVVEAVDVVGAAEVPTVHVALDRAAGTEGLSLDEVADLTSVVSQSLDALGDDVPGVGAGEYLLEVSTVGVDRPLTRPRHFARNVGRLVSVSVDGAEPVTARVLEADEEAVELAVVRPGAKKGMPSRQLPAQRVALDRLGPAHVQVEWASADERGQAPDTAQDT